MPLFIRTLLENRRLALSAAAILALASTGCRKEPIEWEYRGRILEDIRPAAGGEMRVRPDGRLYVFAPMAPALLELMPSDGIPADEYEPTFTEEWMNDSSQRLNRRSVRLFSPTLDGPTRTLFHEYGQQGFWWASPSLDHIRILVKWFDYTRVDEPAHLFLWRSEDGGESFTRIDLEDQGLGWGQATGMHFDAQGHNGYIFVDRNTLWQTRDDGEHWEALKLPSSKADPLPFIESSADCAMVDLQGNLLFSVFDGNATTLHARSTIHRVSTDEASADDHRIAPLHVLEGKRILAIAPEPDGDGLYLAYIGCGKKTTCTWENELASGNPSLHFGWLREGHLETTHAFDFDFLPVEEFHTGVAGRIALILRMPNYPESRLLLSEDHGRNWQVIDITAHEVTSHYLNLDTGEYWQHRRYNRVYQGRLPLSATAH